MKIRGHATFIIFDFREPLQGKAHKEAFRARGDPFQQPPFEPQNQPLDCTKCQLGIGVYSYGIVVLYHSNLGIYLAPNGQCEHRPN